MKTSPAWTPRNRPVIWIWLSCIVLVLKFSSLSAEEIGLPVSIAGVTLGKLNEEIPLTGTVNPIRITRLSAKQAGIVETLYFDEGDAVQAGETIATIDSKLADLELARTRALFQEAEATYKEAQRQKKEAAELVNKKHISATTFESRSAEVEINAAIVQRLKTEVERQREILRRHTVVAPFNGVVTSKLVEIGQWINTDDALLEITELDQLRIEVPVPQFYFSRIQIGTRVRVVFDARPEQAINANVTATVPLGLGNARTFPIKIDIDNQDRTLAPGMSARVYLQLDERNSDEQLLIPRDALVKHSGGTETVWVIREQQGEQRAAPIAVRSGRSQNDMIEILTGDLKQSDRVIIRGNEILQPGQLVHVSEETAPSL